MAARGGGAVTSADRKANRRQQRKAKAKKYSHGESPIWQNQCFKDVFLDIMSRKPVGGSGGGDVAPKLPTAAGGNPSEACLLLVDCLESILDNRQVWTQYYSPSELELINDLIQVREFD
jgi:hypothetical protein